MLACDRDARILAVGKGVFELTGFQEGELLGKDLREALRLHSPSGEDPVSTVLEWGVRKLDQTLELKHRAGIVKLVRADLFPAYDEDGGLLACIAPHGDVDVFMVHDELTRRGWHLDRQGPPDSLHATCTPVHDRIIDELLADLRDSVELARGERTDDRSTSYAKME